MLRFAGALLTLQLFLPAAFAGTDPAPALAPAPEAASSKGAKNKDAKSEVPPPFKIAGKTSQALQKYSGLTFLTEKSLSITGSLLARIVLGGHPSFKIKAYSLTDCVSGKFKSVKLSLKDCAYKKVPLADLELETSTPLQFRLFKNRRGAAGVTAPVMVAVKGEVDEKDVSRALQSPKIASELNFLRLQLPGLGDQHLQVLDPKVTIENGKVKIHTWLITAGAPKNTGVCLDISAMPGLEKERYIMLDDVKVASDDINDPEEFSKFSQDLLNPLLDLGKFDRHTHAFRLNELKLSEQSLQFTGKLLLAPKPVAEKKSPTRLSEK